MSLNNSILVFLIYKFLFIQKIIAQNIIEVQKAEESPIAQSPPSPIVDNPSCDIKVYRSIEDLNSGINAIYENGYVDLIYQEFSNAHHLTDAKENIDKFFILESMNPDTKNFTSIKIRLESYNQTLTKPSYKINSETHSLGSDKQVNSVEVIYDCNKISEGRTEIKLILDGTGCQNIVLLWKKDCKGELVGKNPKIDLSMIIDKTTFPLLTGGEVSDPNYNYFLDKTLSFSISKDKFISQNKIIFKINQNFNKGLLGNIDYTMTPFHIYPPNNNIIHPFLFGDSVVNGGRLTTDQKEFSIYFNCSFSKGMKTDYFSNFQLEIPFDNGQKVNVYFTKLCKLPKMSTLLIVTYIFLIFFIINLVIFLLVLAFIYWLTKDEDFKFTDFLLKVKDKIFGHIIEKFELGKKNKYSEIIKKESEPKEASYVPTPNNKLEFANTESALEDAEDEDDDGFKVQFSFNPNDNNQNSYDCV